MRRFEFKTRLSHLPDFNWCRQTFELRQEFGMASESETIRTVPKYRVVVEMLEACPMFVKAKVQIYEIRGNLGQYKPQFELKTSLKEIEELDRDLNHFVVALPAHVKDLSRRDEDENKN